MKNLKITLCLLISAITGIYAQEKSKTNFFLSAETVEVYDFEASTKSTKGKSFQYEFEDDYTVKLTNKVYRIRLFFDDVKNVKAKEAISEILDGEVITGYKKMVWKKTNQKGKQMYEIELKDNKLKIEVIREQMNTEGYNTLNRLGQKFIEETNS